MVFPPNHIGPREFSVTALLIVVAGESKTRLPNGRKGRLGGKPRGARMWANALDLSADIQGGLLCSCRGSYVET